jgi:hypothetical protein
MDFSIEVPPIVNWRRLASKKDYLRSVWNPADV